MFILFLIEKSKLVDNEKSLSKILKIFSPEIKSIYIKMLKYFNNYRNGKIYKMVNKKRFINEMINAYNIILTKREKNILQKNMKKKYQKMIKYFLQKLFHLYTLKIMSEQYHLGKKCRNYK